MMKEAVHTAVGTLLSHSEWPEANYLALDLAGKSESRLGSR